MKDYIVVGAGIAGISFAHLLEKNNKSFVVFEDKSYHATLTAGGFFNPVILKRFTKVWKAEEQLELLHRFYGEIEEKLGKKFIEKHRLFRRLHSVQEQNQWFEAGDSQALSGLLSTKLTKEIGDKIDSPFGLGEVFQSGRVHNDILVPLYIEHLKKNNYLVESPFKHKEMEILKDSVIYQGIEARRVVFCEGFGLINNPYFNYLPLPGCKGEFLTLNIPGLDLEHVIKADGTLFPIDQKDTYMMGTTHDRDDLTDGPTEKAREEIEEKLRKIIKCDYRVIGQSSAVRPTVLDRRPLVGRHPKYSPLFVLNGLGSRGSMLGPFTATALYNFIEKAEEIDREMNIDRFYKRFYKK